MPFCTPIDKTSIGKVFYIEEDFWPLNTTLYVRDFKGNDPKYVSYFLKTLDFLAFSDKAAVPGINRNHLHMASVLRPPVREQKAIASILGTLDDKIELNRTMNATLEAMAKAIFKSWFVDFDPIPEFAPHKEWQDSPLGKIPKGWTISTIEDLADRVAMGPFGSSIKVSTFVSHGVPVISGQHLHDTMLHDEAYNFISLEHAEKLKNANVFRGEVIFTHAGNIGQVAYIPSNSQYDRYVLSQRQFYMRCNPSKVTPSFIVYYFKSTEGQYKLLANTSTTGVPSISRPVTYLRSIQIQVPPKVVMEEFEKFVQPMHLQIRSNIIQSNTLATIRDALLPKLLAGEIRVKDAEKYEEEKI